MGAMTRKFMPNSKIAQGMTDPFGFGGGGGAGAMFGGGAGGAVGAGGVGTPGAFGTFGEDPMAQQAAVPVQTPMVMKSPMKQEDEEKRNGAPTCFFPP